MRRPLVAAFLSALAVRSVASAESARDAPRMSPAAGQGTPDHGAPASYPAPARASGPCQGFGPQTPRDIANAYGRNTAGFAVAPPPEDLNLCNIHTHTNAEHMGPGLSNYAGGGDHGGFECAGSTRLSPSELSRQHRDGTIFQAVGTGDAIEVHWVYTSCNVSPGPGLGACLSDACKTPTLRVESQVFLVVNDPNALDFCDFIWFGTTREGRYQPRALPTGTGAPVVFRGSTTGTGYTQQVCSPLQVTWSVRPRCARLDIATLDAWAAAGNIFEENHSHGVRQLVTAPELLAPIE
ncbi:hypothetical protein C357_12634 [Citreicella sp. 357]|nr:hypothetical protein C357_12634 [Citreicella sp. 357]